MPGQATARVRQLEEELAALRAAEGAAAGAAAEQRELLTEAKAEAAAARGEADSLRARAQALEHELLEQVQPLRPLWLSCGASVWPL